MLHLTRDFPPRVNGGLSTAVGQMVASQAGSDLRDVAVAVISLDGWRRGAPSRAIAPSEEIADVFRVAGPRNEADLEAARRWGLERRPNLVHVHDPWLFELAAEIAGPTRPIVLSLHVLAHHQDRLRGLERPTRSAEAQARAVSGSAAIIAPSEPVAARLRADMPEAAPRITCVPLALADSEAAAAAAASRAHRPDRHTMLFCGRFSDMSGVDQLPGLSAAIADRHPEAQLVVAGGLPDNPRSERRWRQRLETALGGRGRLTGWLDRWALDAERAAADVFLAPSRYATFGMAPLEAMLFGLPVVAYRTGGLSELVVDGETGFLVDWGDQRSFARAVTALLDNRERALRLGQAGRQRALERYDPTDRVGDVLDLYGHIVDAAV